MLEINKTELVEYEDLSLINRKMFNFKIYTSDKNIVFILRDIKDIKKLLHFIEKIDMKFNYTTLLNTDELYIIKDLYTREKIKLNNINSELSKRKNTKEVNSEFLKKLTLYFSNRKIWIDSKGQRWVKKDLGWSKALSEKESNDYFNSLVWTAPLGYHFIKYEKGKLKYLKFLIYLFTGGLFGTVIIDIVNVFLGGERISPNILDSSKEGNELMYVVPSKDIKNIKKLILSVPYIILILGIVFLVNKTGITLIFKFGELITRRII